MFKNLKKKTKKIQLEKEVKFFFPSYSNFVFAHYTLISPNLQTILKKRITYLGKSQRVLKIIKYQKICHSMGP